LAELLKEKRISPAAKLDSTVVDEFTRFFIGVDNIDGIDGVSESDLIFVDKVDRVFSD